ncbi:MAG: low molecular weight protein arginine phosphatase [Candidatus Zixiibacteriota bacterium]
MYTVMFVCTGNTCRSPMAASALRKLLSDRNIKGISVISSGTSAVVGNPATDNAREAVKIWNADLTDHIAQQVNEDLIDSADLILALTPLHCHEINMLSDNAEDKTYVLKNYPEKGCHGEGVADPIGLPLNEYNKTFIEIGEELGRILPFIIEEAKNTKKSDKAI